MRVPTSQREVELEGRLGNVLTPGPMLLRIREPSGHEHTHPGNPLFTRDQMYGPEPGRTVEPDIAAAPAYVPLAGEGLQDARQYPGPFAFPRNGPLQGINAFPQDRVVGRVLVSQEGDGMPTACRIHRISRGDFHSLCSVTVLTLPRIPAAISSMRSSVSRPTTSRTERTAKVLLSLPCIPAGTFSLTSSVRKLST